MAAHCILGFHASIATVAHCAVLLSLSSKFLPGSSNVCGVLEQKSSRCYDMCSQTLVSLLSVTKSKCSYAF